MCEMLQLSKGDCRCFTLRSLGKPPSPHQALEPRQGLSVSEGSRTQGCRPSGWLCSWAQLTASQGISIQRPPSWGPSAKGFLLRELEELFSTLTHCSVLVLPSSTLSPKSMKQQEPFVWGPLCSEASPSHQLTHLDLDGAFPWEEETEQGEPAPAFWSLPLLLQRVNKALIVTLCRSLS